jgi:hypothetical protein
MRVLEKANPRTWTAFGQVGKLIKRVQKWMELAQESVPWRAMVLAVVNIPITRVVTRILVAEAVTSPQYTTKVTTTAICLATLEFPGVVEGTLRQIFVAVRHIVILWITVPCI